MALIKKENVIQLNKANRMHNEVACTYSIVIDEEGNKFLQLDTYGSQGRKIRDKVSQSIQFDKQTAEFLLSLLT